MFCNYLNHQSRQLIYNIYLNAKAHPAYANYDVEIDEATYFRQGAIAITISRSGNVGNMFLFFSDCVNRGNIGSVAIYGCALEGHKRAIESTMTLFGLPVEDVEWDQGFERFLDVTLSEYSL